jgi:hypothetical protein
MARIPARMLHASAQGGFMQHPGWIGRSRFRGLGSFAKARTWSWGPYELIFERRLALWQTERLNGLMTRKAMVSSNRKMVMTYLFTTLPSPCLDSKLSLKVSR